MMVWLLRYPPTSSWKQGQQGCEATPHRNCCPACKATSDSCRQGQRSRASERHALLLWRGSTA